MRFATRLIAAVILAAAALAAPAAAQQACTIRVESLQGTDWRIKGFDVLDRADPQAQFVVNFKHISGPACSFVPQITLPDPAPGLKGPNGERVPYSLTAGDDSTGVQVTGSSLGRSPNTQGSVLALEPNGSRSITYSFFVPASGLAGDGLYAQDIEISAVPAGRGGAAFGVLLARVGVDVVPSARLGLAGSYRMNGNRAVIELGELTRPGPVGGPLQLQVRSTRRYDIAVESLNGGKLKIANTDWAVPYALSVGGIAAPLTGGVSVLQPPSRKGLAQTALPLQFTITGDPSQQRAGQYEDMLTISVTPKM